MNFSDEQPMRGDFRLEVRRHGELVEVFEEKNLIVNGAKNQLARLVGGSGANRQITQIGFGIHDREQLARLEAAVQLHSIEQ